MAVISFSLVFLVPLSVVAGYIAGGAFLFLTPVLVFGVIPILDMIIGIDTRNPDENSVGFLADQKAYRYITWVCAPLQVGIVVWSAYMAAFSTLGPLEWMGLTVSAGVSSGVMGINVAHELAHRVNNNFEPLLSRIMLWTVLYGHWGLEHVVGHHRHVATPEDPATARLGESFYRFWPRTVTGGFNSAWTFEAARMQKAGNAVWHVSNRMVRALGAELLILLCVALLFGWRGLLFWLLQAFIAITLLELVNYVEHYGLLREKLGENRYEPVRPVHSWNASHWLTNRFLFNLQRHSDHHYKPGRRYQVLRHYDESPQLPNGYAGMIVLALIPPLWRRVMDRRAEVRKNNAVSAGTQIV